MCELCSKVYWEFWQRLHIGSCLLECLCLRQLGSQHAVELPCPLFRRCSDAAGGESNAGTSIGPENSALSGSGHETFTGDAGGFSGQAGHDSADTEAVLVRAHRLLKRRACIGVGCIKGALLDPGCTFSTGHNFGAFLVCSQTWKLMVHFVLALVPSLHLDVHLLGPHGDLLLHLVRWTPLWPGRCALLPAEHHCSCPACVCRDP